ncbi:hypothetical protein [Acinetobacter haemolyticus]|uniref:Uncharacterized protein n=1 Tax=Acinetobacter haemolyticus TaxID=29430 RepID=A0A3R9R7B7_ACIHA|nr:hypothetical protein [Acinetobacter haemolyticus]NAR75552.1 hypothetical protein [Acinetobacter haemolyticus]QHI08930.1 hypothetical protein AhaeAN59_01780 [Acinetobacter haemolyticus]QHI12196.1 hypothetical protein AhaeAN43_01770 [Acinetobacter haemolyticus]RSN76374.1 hypothetical protein EA769_07950 [Acinetobacter haemolyticus]
MAVSRSIWQNIQQYSWLVLALACLIAALVFWAVTDRDALVEVEQPSKTETSVQIQPEKVAATTHLGALSDSVRPLDLKARVVVANEHLPEFRGTKFVKDNQRRWTMEIFRSSNEAIIKNFLLNRSDRKKFTYFRLSGQDQVEQYVLVYGLFANPDEANRQFAQLELSLPESIQPKAQRLEAYVDLVNDLGADEMKLSTNQLYAIQLKPAALPKVDETLLIGTTRSATSANKATSSADASTTVRTTVTRRDAQGNVVNVQQNQSAVHTPTNAEKIKENSDSSKREISDPFN